MICGKEYIYYLALGVTFHCSSHHHGAHLKVETNNRFQGYNTFLDFYLFYLKAVFNFVIWVNSAIPHQHHSPSFPEEEGGRVQRQKSFTLIILVDHHLS